MPDPQSQLVDWVNAVAKSVTESGGTVVRKFSQSLPSTSQLMGMYGVTKNGICQALTNKWIAEHANGGSLWNWLCGPGGHVQMSKIANLMINFIDSVSFSAPAASTRRSSTPRSTCSSTA